jgi:carbonic anhydrase
MNQSLSRRALVVAGSAMALAPTAACAASGGSGARAATAAPPMPGARPTPTQALARLQEGNRRFVAGTATPMSAAAARRAELAQSQAPFAAIVACSDSRVPPELLFDVGLGDVFVIRNAGNVVEDTAMGSLQYAVGPLSVPLILVLGHERCGAVSAAAEVIERGTAFPTAIADLVQPILPAALAARTNTGISLDSAIRINVERQVRRLRQSRDQIVAEPLQAGRLQIVGAVYDLDEGRVTFLPG